MNRISRFFGLLLTFVTTMIFISIPAVGYTQGSVAPTSTSSPPASGCNELQVIFMIDQSGSMVGFTDSRGRPVPPSDPDGLRFLGPEKFTESLASLRYQAYQGATIRLAIIHFASQPATHSHPDTDEEWQTITPSSQADYTATLQFLNDYFEPTPALPEGENYTLPSNAMPVALTLFEELNTPLVDGCPIRSIIFITDGEPNDGNDNYDAVGHLEDIAEYVRTNMPPSDYHIYVIGLDENGNYFEDLRDEWEAIAGDPARVVLAESATEMAGVLNLIANELTRELQTQGADYLFACAETGELIIPPYIQELRLTYTKSQGPTEHLEVVDALNRSVTASLSNVTILGYDEAIETLVISNPEPGIWQILTQLPPNARDSCQVAMLAFKATERVSKPTPGQQIAQYQTLDVDFQIVDANGNSLPPYQNPDYQLEMDIQLIADTGEVQEFTLGADPGQPYQGSIPVLYPGANQLVVTTRNINLADGSVFNLYDDGSKTVRTIEVLPVELHTTIAPPATLEQYQDLTFAFALSVGQQQPITIDLPYQAKVELIRDGQSPQPLITVEHQGVFSGTAKMDTAGDYTLRYWVEVQTSNGVEILGPQETVFNVLPIELLRATFVSPGKMIATSWLGPLGPATGIDVAVQLANAAGNNIGTANVITSDPTRVFKLTAFDEKGNDVSDRLKLVQANQPGLFQVAPNDLGPGVYRIMVEPEAQLARGYNWETTSWSYEVQGLVNPTFYTAIAVALLSLVLLVATVLYLARLRMHPLSGQLVIYQQVENRDGSTFDKRVWTQSLPKRNRASFRPRLTGATKSMSVERVSVNCNPEQSKNKQARVEVKLKGQKPRSSILVPGGAGLSLGAGYTLAKDPATRGSSSRHSELPDTF